MENTFPLKNKSHIPLGRLSLPDPLDQNFVCIFRFRIGGLTVLINAKAMVSRFAVLGTKLIVTLKPHGIERKETPAVPGVRSSVVYVKFGSAQRLRYLRDSFIKLYSMELSECVVWEVKTRTQ